MPNILYLSLSLSLLEYPTYFAYDTEHIDRHGTLMLMCVCVQIYMCVMYGDSAGSGWHTDSATHPRADINMLCANV